MDREIMDENENKNKNGIKLYQWINKQNRPGKTIVKKE